jgi:uncharacterized protein YycO
MKTLICAIAVIALAATLCVAGELPLREGDVVFQSFPSPQCRAIQLATRSQFSHVGMILMHRGRLMVYEAVSPVKFTPIDAWIQRDAGHHFVARRLKNADSILTRAALQRMDSVAVSYEGRPYDSAFNWSDEKLYCSEVVWKVYHQGAGVQVGTLRKLKEFDFTSSEVRKKLKERYPDGIPLEETVVSPEDVFQSALLQTVYQQ